jgi:hypothetical protein
MVGLAASPGDKSDPLCPHIVACEYEAPAFTIRVVDKQTGQPLAGIHGIATWIAYGGPRRRWPLMVLEAVSGPDGQLAFPAWGPVRSGTEGVLPGDDPVISLFLPGYRAALIYNASPIGLPHTARVRSFDPAGRAFALVPFQGTTAELLAELRKAGDPFDGEAVSEHDPESFQQTYVNRLKRVIPQVERIPNRTRDVENFLWTLNADIRSYKRGGGR